MAESSDVLINAGVFGVLLPAVAAGVGGAIGRLNHPAVRATAGLGVGAGVWVAATRLAGTPPWPPIEATQWVPFAALLGAAVGAVLGPAMAVPALERRPWLGFAARVAAVAALLAWTLGRLLAPLRDVGDAIPDFGREIARLTALGALGYAGLDALFTPRRGASDASAEPRLRAFLAVSAAGVLLGGTAAIVALARSALLGQLLGAAAATVGGLALAAAAGAPRVALRSAAPALAVPLTVVVAAALHYASLPPMAAWLLLAAPALAAAALWLAPTGGRGWTAVAATVVAAAVVGGTGAWAKGALDAADDAPSAAPGEVELDYGYGGGSSEAEPTDDTTPDPYGDPKAMENWKPPDAPDTAP